MHLDYPRFGLRLILKMHFFGILTFFNTFILAQNSTQCRKNPCGGNTTCAEIPPDSFHCTCSVGFTGDAVQGCTGEYRL
jgi:hypothetical protein